MKDDAKLVMVAYAPKASALESHCRIYSVDGASPTIPTCSGGGDTAVDYDRRDGA